MTESENKVETETFRRLERLRELRIEHRDLDDVINRLQMDLYVNEVQLRSSLLCQLSRAPGSQGGVFRAVGRKQNFHR